MRKAPVYVGYNASAVFNIDDINPRSYLTDSQYGELTIPAHVSSSDQYLYVVVPKAYFKMKTVETIDGSVDSALQILQNGFTVGSLTNSGSNDYFVYRSSQAISEHSTLELK